MKTIAYILTIISIFLLNSCYNSAIEKQINSIINYIKEDSLAKKSFFNSYSKIKEICFNLDSVSTYIPLHYYTIKKLNIYESSDRDFIENKEEERLDSYKKILINKTLLDLCSESEMYLYFDIFQSNMIIVRLEPLIVRQYFAQDITYLFIFKGNDIVKVKSVITN